MNSSMNKATHIRPRRKRNTRTHDGNCKLPFQKSRGITGRHRKKDDLAKTNNGEKNQEVNEFQI